MTGEAPPSAEPSVTQLFARMPRALQWLGVLVLSLLFAGTLHLAGLPAAALIGPMLGAALAGVNGATVRVPSQGFFAAQSVLGVLIATTIEPEILAAFLGEWPLFLGVVVSTVAASSFLGWTISRWKILPGSTAVWGSAPGASTAMVLMAAAFGADERLVAFMQYLRIIMVAVAAAAIAGLFVEGAAAEAPSAALFPPLDGPALAATAVVAAAGGLAGRLLRLPSPYFLGALIPGIALHLGAGVEFQLPPWLLIASYGLIGWSIGLNFTRAIVRHAARALPQIVGSILVLMGFCCVLALILNRALGVDLLTAYLATSPGGMDSVAIIAAAASNVNMSFVMALQMARFLFVLLLGPAIARLLARTVKD